MIIDLATVYRKQQIESIHYGIAVLVKGNQVIKAWGDADFKCFTRSIIKPIQAKVSLSFLNEDLASEFIAIACASHTQSEEQMKLLDEFALKYKIDEGDLELGLLKGSTANSALLKSKFHHNCAGKHCLMCLAARKIENAEIGQICKPYTEETHSLQQALISEIKKLLDLEKNISLDIATDGCGVPTFHLSLKDMARLFVKTIANPDYEMIYAAMSQHPYIIGGKDRIDSLVMAKRPKELIAKGGPEGLMLILNLKREEVLLIKIIDGSSRAKSIITKGFLEYLAWLDKDEILVEEEILNSQGLIVGNIAFNVR